MTRYLGVFIVYMVTLCSGIASINDVKVILFPIQEAILSATINSNIIKYHYKEGEEFKKDSTLVTLDDSLYKQSQIMAEEEFKGATASYTYTTDIYKHNIKLYKQKAVGSQEVELSKLENLEAFSRLNKAKANLVIANIQLDACDIKAPYDGRIYNNVIHEYDYVRTGEPVLQIINDNRLLALMHVKSNIFKHIRLGMKVIIYIKEIDSRYNGIIYEMASSINPTSKTLEVKVLLENKDNKLLSGMSGRLITDNFIGKK